MVLHSGSPTGTSSDEDLTLIIALVACLVTVAIIFTVFVSICKKRRESCEIYIHSQQ